MAVTAVAAAAAAVVVVVFFKCPDRPSGGKIAILPRPTITAKTNVVNTGGGRDKCRMQVLTVLRGHHDRRISSPVDIPRTQLTTERFVCSC